MIPNIPISRGDWFRQEAVDYVNSIAETGRLFEDNYEPLMRMLARSRIIESSAAEIIRVAITGSEPIGSNIYKYTGARLSDWNETLHTWTAGVPLTNVSFYNTWEDGNTLTRVMGGITVDNINLTMLPVPPNAEKPVGAIVIAEKVGANSYVFEYPNAIKVVCPQ